MMKKMMILAALAFTLASSVSASTTFWPAPSCYPCDGSGN